MSRKDACILNRPGMSLSPCGRSSPSLPPSLCTHPALTPPSLKNFFRYFFFYAHRICTVPSSSYWATTRQASGFSTRLGTASAEPHSTSPLTGVERRARHATAARRQRQHIMAKKRTSVVVRLMSQAGTGYFYTLRRAIRANQEK